MSEHHVTLPLCPVCGAEHEAVGRWRSGNATDGEIRWHCFHCDANGTLVIEIQTDPIPPAPAGREGF